MKFEFALCITTPCRLLLVMTSGKQNEFFRSPNKLDFQISGFQFAFADRAFLPALASFHTSPTMTGHIFKPSGKDTVEQWEVLRFEISKGLVDNVSSSAYVHSFRQGTPKTNMIRTSEGSSTDTESLSSSCSLSMLLKT